MECQTIPVLDYLTFNNRLVEKVRQRNIPASGQIDFTYRCNLACRHCYAVNDSAEAELDYSEICRIIDELVDEGCLNLLLSGGDPLIRKDFTELYKYIKRRGIFPVLFTNGTLITRKIADMLAEWPPYIVEISMYGVTPETYRQVTGSYDAYYKCMAAVQMLIDRGVRLHIKAIAMSLNSHEVWKIRDFAQSRHLRFRFDPVITPRLDRGKSPYQVRLSPEEIVTLDMEDITQTESWREALSKPREVVGHDFTYMCGAGVGNFYISPYGKLQVCVLSVDPSYDLRTGSFREGYYEFLQSLRRQKLQKDIPCRRCDKISVCGHCTAWSFLEHGEFGVPVEYLCRLADLRIERFSNAGGEDEQFVKKEEGVHKA